MTGSFSDFSEDRTITRGPSDSGGSSTYDDVTMPPDLTGPVQKGHVEKFDLETVGPYRLVRKLGQGGMGTVFEAQHIDTGRSVALKLLSPEVRGTDEMVKRFQRESQIAASINHPRSTFVYESGDHDGQLYITMELMGGGTLKDVIANEGPLPLNRAVDFVLDIIDGLLVAHNAGIVHRDLKPSNSFVDHDGRIKVGDFGLAKSFLGDSSLTQTGTFMGTPQYAAPEQIRNADVDERTDIYALGGTLFYLLSGRAPFVGNPAQVISSIASDTPPKINSVIKGVPKQVEKLIAQTLEKDPNRRPFNLNVVRDSLLPFSTRGALAADPGRRMGAFFADSFFVLAVGITLISFASPLIIFIFGALGIEINPQVAGAAIYVPWGVFYFSFSEWRFGRTIGKWFFGMRVVNDRSQSPDFWQSFVRGFFIPGFMLIVSQGIAIYYLSEMTTDFLQFWFKSQLTERLLVWGSLLAMLSTARKSNGYRGVHDLLTGTRVVRLAGDLDSRLLDHFAVAVPQRQTDGQSIGEYEQIGSYGKQENGQEVILGRDNKLDRVVWLFRGFNDDGIDAARRQLTRPTRLRIINQATDGSNWYATESAPGVPLIEVLRQFPCSWKSTCALFRDVAYELALAEENDAIPSGLTIDHVWLEHSGGIRLLDHPVVSSGKLAQSQDPDPRRQAINVIHDLLDRYMQLQDHPVSIMELANQLDQKRDDEDVFDWLVSELNDSIDNQTTWSWIDRAGMSAITFGIEFSVVFLALFVVSFWFGGFSLVAGTVVAAVVGFGIVAAFGFFVNGGPAMRLSNVQLCSWSTKKPVSPLRVAIRNMIAWTPLILMLMTFFSIMFGSQNQERIFGIDIADSSVQTWGFLMMFLLMLAVVGFMFFSILSPTRGVPELLTRTRLMRK